MDYFNPSAMIPKGDPQYWSPGPTASREIFDTQFRDYNTLMDLYKVAQQEELSKSQMANEFTRSTQPSKILSENATNQATAGTIMDLKRGQADTARAGGLREIATWQGNANATNAENAAKVPGFQTQQLMNQTHLEALAELLQRSRMAGTPAEGAAVQQIVASNPQFASDPAIQAALKAGPPPGGSMADTFRMLAQYNHETSPQYHQEAQKGDNTLRSTNAQGAWHLAGTAMTNETTRRGQDIASADRRAAIAAKAQIDAEAKKVEMRIAQLIRKHADGTMQKPELDELNLLRQRETQLKQAQIQANAAIAGNFVPGVGGAVQGFTPYTMPGEQPKVETKEINGKTYFKQGNDWYTQ